MSHLVSDVCVVVCGQITGRICFSVGLSVHVLASVSKRRYQHLFVENTVFAGAQREGDAGELALL